MSNTPRTPKVQLGRAEVIIRFQNVKRATGRQDNTDGRSSTVILIRKEIRFILGGVLRKVI